MQNDETEQIDEINADDDNVNVKYIVENDEIECRQIIDEQIE